jgi:hypothetical protein
MLTPQPTLASAGNPQRLSTTDIWVRSFVIEAHENNDGVLYLSSSESLASSNNRHCFHAGDRMHFKVDNWGGLDGFFNLYDLWIDGSSSNDLFVVSYIQDRDFMFGGKT